METLFRFKRRGLAAPAAPHRSRLGGDSMHPNRPLLLAAVALVAGTAPAWAGTAELVSVSSSGAPAERSSGDPSISADGRFVAVRVTNNSSQTSNCPGLSGFMTCVFVHDRGPADN